MAYLRYTGTISDSSFEAGFSFVGTGTTGPALTGLRFEANRTVRWTGPGSTDVTVTWNVEDLDSIIITVDESRGPMTSANLQETYGAASFTLAL